MGFTIDAVDGWVFTCKLEASEVGGPAFLAGFKLRGECPHGRELLVHDQSAVHSASCECKPTTRVLALRDRLLAEWNAKIGQALSVA